MSPEDVAVLIVALLLCSWQVGLFLCKGDRHAVATWARTAKSRFVEWLALLSPHRVAARVPAARDPLEREIEDSLITKRLGMADLVYEWAATFFFGVFIVVLSRGFRDEDESRVLTFCGDIVLMLLYSIVLCIRALPRLLRAPWMPYYYAVGMFLGTVLVTPLCTDDAASRPHLNSLMVGYRLFLNMTTSNILHVVFWNTAYTATYICSLVLGPHQCADRVSSRQYIFEVGAWVYLIIAAVAVESSLRTQTRQEIKGRRAMDESCAATSLLNAITDAVVVLDDDLRIVKDSPQLSTMLLRGPGGSLEGLTLEQFVPSTDWEDFTARLLDKDVLSTSLAAVLHQDMRDSWGNTVEVEIFHVCTQATSRPDHHVHHILGIREYGSSEYRTQRGEQAMYPDEGGVVRGHHVPSILEVDTGQVMIKFDAFTSMVTKYSSSFISLCGGPPAVQIFWEWVQSKGRRPAKEYFTELVNNFMNSEYVESDPSSLQGLRFKVPLSTSQARFSADCTFTLHAEMDSECEEEDDTVCATVVFTNILVNVVRSDGDNVADDSGEGGDEGGA